jgi:uncharacterized RDD family membrane protein YckC
MIARRAGALLLDWIFAFFLVYLTVQFGHLAGFLPDTVDGTRGTVLDQSLWMICLIASQVYFQTRKKYPGQSLGKQLFRLHIMQSDSPDTLTVAQLAGRETVKILAIPLLLLQPALAFLLIFPLADFLWALKDSDRSLHDLLFKTQVCKKANTAGS